jgi:hypothetical protein
MPQRHPLYTRYEDFRRWVDQILDDYQIFPVDTETVVILDAKRTSWFNRKPITHTERGLKFGQFYMLIESGLIGRPVRQPYGNELLEAIDFDRFLASEVIGRSFSDDEAQGILLAISTTLTPYLRRIYA